MSIRLFEDSNHAKIYHRYRPTVPDVVINEVIIFLKEKIDPNDWDIAVDVGCGSGQATNQLSKHFRHCYGTDISEAQINEAKESKHSNNVCFNVCSAEDMPQIGTNSVQLVTAFTAAHWFQIPEFFKECDRILVDNGVIALVSHKGFDISDPNNPNNSFSKWFYHYLFPKYMKQYKHKNIDIFENKYKDIIFPQNYDYVYKDNISASVELSADQLVGWLHSISVFQELMSDNRQLSEEVLKEFIEKLKISQNINDMSKQEITANYQYFIAMGRKQ